jgi:hypothetical protein
MNHGTVLVISYPQFVLDFIPYMRTVGTILLEKKTYFLLVQFCGRWEVG